MNAIDQLNAYLQGIERRLRLMAISRGAAITAVCALLMTVALVLITNSFAFSPGSLLWARILLFLSLAVALGFRAGDAVVAHEPAPRRVDRRAEIRGFQRTSVDGD